ncbi:MAG: tetratricopeptide repeat protein [Candidatus Schekmanbacteria bacterium]|nr:tetratricopeptide repeat protein [Candidatus Schekmanbacteria bacterium]
MAEIPKNTPCPCGSGKKYKRCCGVKNYRGNPGNSKPIAKNYHDWRVTVAVIVLIIGIGFTIYSNTFHAPFTFDDALLEQERDQQANIDVTSLKSITGRQRLLSYLSFDLNYAMGGNDPYVYHLTNIAIHVVAAITIYFLVLATLNLPALLAQYGQISQSAAALTALFFVAHPVQTQAVSYIIQRMTSLAGMFYLFSFLAYIKGRVSLGAKRTVLYLLAVFCALLAFSSKQHTVVLPLVILLYEFFFFQELDFSRYKKLLSVISLFLILPIAVGVFYLQDINWLLSGYNQYDFSMWEKIITEFRVLIYYVSILLLPLPSRLNLDYDYSVSRSLVNPPATLISLIAVCALLFWAARTAKKRPLVSFCIFWFLLNLMLETFFLPIEIIYEHRLYLPAIGFFLIAAVYIIQFFRRYPLPILLEITVVIVALLGWGTYERNKIWGSEISLWSDVVQKSPKKARPHNNLGKAYATAGLSTTDKVLSDKYSDLAIKEYTQAVTLNPANYVAFDNLGQSYGRKEMTDEAIRACREAVRLKPDYMPAYNNLGVAYNRKKRYKEAMEACSKALELNPRYAKAHFNLGRAYDGLKRYDEAIITFRKALEFRPDDANIPYNIGNAYFNKGENEKALEYYLQTIKMSPDFINAYYNLGVLYFNKGEIAKAAEQYSKMIKLNPRHAPAYERLGLIYFYKLNDKEKARESFQKVVEFARNGVEAELAKKMLQRLH